MAGRTQHGATRTYGRNNQNGVRGRQQVLADEALIRDIDREIERMDRFVRALRDDIESVEKAQRTRASKRNLGKLREQVTELQAGLQQLRSRVEEIHPDR